MFDQLIRDQGGWVIIETVSKQVVNPQTTILTNRPA